MKRRVTRFIAGAMTAFLLAGCGSTGSSNTQNDTAAVTEKENSSTDTVSDSTEAVTIKNDLSHIRNRAGGVRQN